MAKNFDPIKRGRAEKSNVAPSDSSTLDAAPSSLRANENDNGPQPLETLPPCLENAWLLSEVDESGRPYWLWAGY